MDPVISADTIRDYTAHLNAAVGADKSVYALVPSWGNYVGNGANDAWAKADAALKTWPSTFPEYAATGDFPRTGLGAAQAGRLLRNLQTAEAKAKLDDPLHIGFGGDPEQRAAFDHDFEHGVAAAAHDLKGEVAADAKFAVRSEVNAGSALRQGDLVHAGLDHAAARFIGEGEVDLDGAVGGGRAVSSTAARGAEAMDASVLAARSTALQALETLQPH